MRYKNYTCTITISEEHNCFVGKLDVEPDIVSFYAYTIVDFIWEFKNAVDDYLETCKQLNREPNTPFKKMVKRITDDWKWE